MRAGQLDGSIRHERESVRPRLAGRVQAIGGFARGLWDRQSIRSRLLLIVVALEVIAAVIAGGVAIVKARTATRIEIDASVRTAELLVDESLRLVRNDIPATRVLETLPLRLSFLRHVRLSVLDADGQPVPRAGGPEEPGARPDRRLPAPDWFYALTAPPIRTESIPVVAQGHTIGSVDLVTEPADEIAEAWENAVAVGGVAFGVNALILAALYILFGRALAPLAALTRGLADLEQRKYAVRLASPRTHELSQLADRFNALATALETARAENLDLTRRLVTAQDDERRRTARELHDEVGPCLFGLKATIASASAAGDPAVRAKRARDMLEIIEHLQVINRNMLNRLRPMALGHVPLTTLLDQTVRDRARTHPGIALGFHAHGLAASYGDALDLTIYRCIQESLTNAIRHASASSVKVLLREVSVPRATLELAVTDDGRGFAPGTPWGFGLRGMRERVVALGGEFSISTSASGGTIVNVTIPLPHDDATEAQDRSEAST